MATTGRSCLECGYAMVKCYYIPTFNVASVCPNCPVTDEHSLVFGVRGMRIALTGEQLRNPGAFLEAAASKPMALQHAFEDLCNQLVGYRLYRGSETVVGGVPAWRRANGRGYIHARCVISLSTFSYGPHRFHLFVYEPTVTSVNVRYSSRST